MNNEIAIDIDSVGFSYSHNNPVLRDVTAHVPKGKYYCFNILLLILFANKNVGSTKNKHIEVVA